MLPTSESRILPVVHAYGRIIHLFTVAASRPRGQENDCVGNVSSVDIESSDQQVANIRQLSDFLIPGLLLRKRAACCTFPNRCAKRLVRVLLNSSIDRRVLDEEHPDSTQSARDRQSIQNRPGGMLFTPLPEQRPVISIESINSVTRRRLAIRPSRASLFSSKRAHAYSEFLGTSPHTRTDSPCSCRPRKSVEQGYRS